MFLHPKIIERAKFKEERDKIATSLIQNGYNLFEIQNILFSPYRTHLKMEMLKLVKCRIKPPLSYKKTYKDGKIQHN